MTTQRIVQGWRAFSSTEESTFGTPESLSATIGRLNFEGEPTEVKEKMCSTTPMKSQDQTRQLRSTS